MTYTMKDFQKGYIKEHLDVLSPDERLKGISPDVRLRGRAPDDRLKGLSDEEIKRYLAKLEK